MARGKWVKNFKTVRLDVRAVRADLLKALRKLNEAAGQAWIREVVDATPIPTWSGASRATFAKLAAELGTSVPIGPIRSKRNRVQLGLSTSAGSGVEADVKGGSYYVGFKYETDLRYLAYNEYNSAVAGRPPAPFSNNVRFTPYKFQDRGRRTWEAVAKKAKKYLPNPYRHLIIRKI